MAFKKNKILINFAAYSLLFLGGLFSLSILVFAIFLSINLKNVNIAKLFLTDFILFIIALIIFLIFFSLFEFFKSAVEVEDEIAELEDEIETLKKNLEEKGDK